MSLTMLRSAVEVWQNGQAACLTRLNGCRFALTYRCARSGLEMRHVHSLIRSLIIVLLLLPVAGCFSDQKAAASRCTANAKAHYARLAGQSEEEYLDFLGGPIVDCMKAAGYYYYEDQPDCDGTASNPYCYRDAKKHYSNKTQW